MRINIKLMGGLQRFQPDSTPLEFDGDTTIDQIVARLGIAAEQVQVVLVDGKPQPDRSTICRDGQTLTILPIVGGG